MKKYYFVLLEILIALTLIALLSIPLTRNPIYFYKKELSSLKELEMKRIENESFNLLKEKLFKNEIPLKSLLVESKKEAKFVKLTEEPLNIHGFVDQNIPVFYKITLIKQKKTYDSTFYKLNVLIALTEKQITYPPHVVIVQKIAAGPLTSGGLPKKP